MEVDGIATQDISLDLLEAGPDLDVIARQVIVGKRKLKRTVPSQADLAASLTGISITDTIKGSSTLTLTMYDDEWALMESGFFDNNEDGRLDAIDVNYPDGSRFWWRITQVNPSANRTIEVVLMERAAVYLMAHRGPVKTSRAKKTRAEFLKGLSDKVKAGGGIKFYSKELHKKQKTEADPGGEAAKEEAKAAKKDEKEREENKDIGINSDERLKIKGHRATKDQLSQVERALGEAEDLNAPELAVIAMLCAGIGESGFKAIPNAGGSNYHGVFQGSKDVFDVDDTEEEAKCFLKGGKGFQAGGAIALANANPDMDPGDIATKVEASGQPGSFYGKYKEEAKKLLEAGGGGSFGGTSYRAQYNFQVGSEEEPHETYWDAMNRLADEVKWAIFLDGSRLYFDSEPTLMRQKPALVIGRDDPRVVDWDGTWDARHIATELTLELICDPFEFRAGQVFKLDGFGPFSTGTTMKKPKLPGRWLVSEVERERTSLTSSFTLKQPEYPNREPVSEIKERDDASSGDSIGSGDLYEACKKISDEGHSYPHPMVHHGPWSNITKSTPLDCSESTSLALHMAGLFDEPQAWVSGQFASSYGVAGRGDEWSVYANAGHVFIQSEGSGSKWRFDTGGHPGISGPRLLNEWRSTAGFTPRHKGSSK